jgi:hypothetical protein
MKKFITSIFLILSLVTTGLMGFTPTVSAINKSAVRCDFLGQYINPSATGNPCQPCPENNYCPLVSGTAIENCATKGYPETDCKETRKIFSTDKAIPCPSGTFTKGYTYNTLQGTRITSEGDLFPVGQGATDESMCKAPDFKCPLETPVLIKGVDGVAKCVPPNTCAADQVPILKDGIPDCSVACKSNTLVGGKCYQDCPEGEYLEVKTSNGTQTVSCKKITITNTNCPVIGQIPTTPGDISTCVCAKGQVVNTSVTPNKCETPIIPCKPPQTGNEPNCINPITTCPKGTYGISQPNCTPCPNGGTTDSANQTTIRACYYIKQCEAGTYGEGRVWGNDQPYCTPCPANSTSPAGTTVASGCVAKQGGGEGFCGGWWLVACGAAVVGAACIFKFFGLCGSGDSASDLTKPSITKSQRQTSGTTERSDLLSVVKVKASASSCSGTNESLVNSVYNNNSADAHPSKGDKYLWVATVAAGTATEKMSTVRPAQGQTGSLDRPVDADLLCLMQRFAKKNNKEFGSPAYMEALCGGKNSKGICQGVLHGLNKAKKLECINLSKLLASFNGDTGETQESSEYYAIKNKTKGYTYSEKYATKELAEKARQGMRRFVKSVNIKTENLVIKTENGKEITGAATASYDDPDAKQENKPVTDSVDIEQPKPEVTAEEVTGYWNNFDIKNVTQVILPVKVSAQDENDAYPGAVVSADVEDFPTSEADEEEVTGEVSLEFCTDLGGNEIDCPIEENSDGSSTSVDSNNNGVVNDTCFGVFVSWLPGCKTEAEKSSYAQPKLYSGDPCSTENYDQGNCNQDTCNRSIYDCEDQPIANLDFKDQTSDPCQPNYVGPKGNSCYGPTNNCEPPSVFYAYAQKCVAPEEDQNNSNQAEIDKCNNNNNTKWNYTTGTCVPYNAEPNDGQASREKYYCEEVNGGKYTDGDCIYTQTTKPCEENYSGSESCYGPKNFCDAPEVFNIYAQKCVAPEEDQNNSN